MEVIHERVAGLDVHKGQRRGVRADQCRRGQGEAGVSHLRGRRQRTLEALRDWITSWGMRTLVAMEATGVYWLPIWTILLGGAFEMNIANARHIKAVLGRKTDMNDAMWIADLAAYGLDQGELRARRRVPRAAHADADAQAARARSDQPRPAHPEDADRGQHPPGSGDQRHHGRQRSAHDRGDDRGAFAIPANWRRWAIDG